jgi:hypothetical protein
MNPRRQDAEDESVIGRDSNEHVVGQDRNVKKLKNPVFGRFDRDNVSIETI